MLIGYFRIYFNPKNLIHNNVSFNQFTNHSILSIFKACARTLRANSVESILFIFTNYTKKKSLIFSAI